MKKQEAHIKATHHDARVARLAVANPPQVTNLVDLYIMK